MGLINETNSKTIKAKAKKNKQKTVYCDQPMPQQTYRCFCIIFGLPTLSQATGQSTVCMCASVCTLWGLMTGTGFSTIKKRHKQQAVESGLIQLQRLSVWEHHLHLDDMIWCNSMKSTNIVMLPSCGLAVWYSNCIWQFVEGLWWFWALSGRRGGHMAPGLHLEPVEDKKTRKNCCHLILHTIKRNSGW